MCRNFGVVENRCHLFAIHHRCLLVASFYCECDSPNTKYVYVLGFLLSKNGRDGCAGCPGRIILLLNFFGIHVAITSISWWLNCLGIHTERLSLVWGLCPYSFLILVVCDKMNMNLQEVHVKLSNQILGRCRTLQHHWVTQICWCINICLYYICIFLGCLTTVDMLSVAHSFAHRRKNSRFILCMFIDECRLRREKAMQRPKTHCFC